MDSQRILIKNIRQLLQFSWHDQSKQYRFQVVPLAQIKKQMNERSIFILTAMANLKKKQMCSLFQWS